MSDINELYQEVIIDHGRHPRNAGILEGATHQKEGYNPLCGDKVTVYCLVENHTVKEMRFVGCGCAISLASSSLMSQVIQGKTEAEINALFCQFRAMVMGEKVTCPDSMGKLSVLEGVKMYPSRVKCALLGWYTLLSALNNSQEEVTTE